MPTLIKDDRLKDIRLPEFDRSKVELPEVDLSKLEMPKIDLSKIEVPKVDLAKAVAGAATAVGLAKPRRARWPFVVAAGIAVAVAGLFVMNSAPIRERLSRARTWIGDQVGAIQAGNEDLESVAFPSAPTAPLDQAMIDSVSGSTGADYPEGLGATADSLATNGRKVGAGTR